MRQERGILGSKAAAPIKEKGGTDVMEENLRGRTTPPSQHRWEQTRKRARGR